MCVVGQKRGVALVHGQSVEIYVKIVNKEV
jgi:hypothetical protein